MADKAISELVAASQVKPSDLFVLEQDNAPKKLTGQILENWLVSFADGHGGIQSIAYLSTDVLEDTYVITLADTTTFEFTVTNGKSITGITKSGSSGLTDTYKISYNDGTSTTFPVTNGRGIKSWTESISGLAHTYAITYDDNTTTFLQIKDGAKGDKGDNANIWIKYASQEPTVESHSMSDIPDDWMGVYSGHAESAPTDWQQYKWSRTKGDKGDKGDPALLQSQAVAYQVSDSGTIIPSGSWSSSIPVVSQGKYLWTRSTINFNSGNPVVSYSVSRMGLDGAGSVSSVANISPDSNGNVPLAAGDVGALPSTGGDVTGELRMNGQPISGLNPPTEETEAANKGYVDESVKGAAPHNILDNSDFRNPVNQRGASSYNTAHAYCIDRWKLNDYAGTGTLAVTASGVKLTPASGVAEISQKLERSASFTGKNMTFAVKILGASSPNILSVTFGTNHSSVEANGCQLIHWSNDFLIRVSSEKTIEWAALYEGTYTADTLPEYHPKGYAAELAECQRYFYQTSGELVLSGYITGSAKRLYVGIHLPEMRISPSLANPVPTMTVRTTAGYSPVANNTSPFGTPTAQAITAFNRAGGDASMYFEFSDEIGTNNTPAVAQFRGSSYLAFSADL